jgi:hypothetical protein
VNFDYLCEHDERAVRTALLTSLAALQKRGQSTFEYVAVVHEVAKALLKYPEVNEAAKVWETYQTGYSTKPEGEEHPDNRKLLSAVWGLIGEGIVYPRMKSYSRDGHPHIIDKLALTARGARAVVGGDQHPLHPGFIQRFRQRAPNVSDEVVARMEDAVSCLEGHLLRAALVMVGLAVEETLRVTHAAMVNQSHIAKGAGALTKAKQILDDIEKAGQSWTTKDDERHHLKVAIVAAESIRTERNKASHPGAVVTDAAAVEEVAVLASRQIPAFWAIPIQQAVTNGFVP